MKTTVAGSTTLDSSLRAYAPFDAAARELEDLEALHTDHVRTGLATNEVAEQARKCATDPREAFRSAPGKKAAEWATEAERRRLAAFDQDLATIALEAQLSAARDKVESLRPAAEEHLLARQ